MSVSTTSSITAPSSAAEVYKRQRTGEPEPVLAAADQKVQDVVRSVIIDTNNFGDLLHHITPKSLILYDIDNTILEPPQTLGSDQWFTWRISFHQNAGHNAKDALEIALMEWVSVQCLTKVKIVQPGTENVIRHIQEQAFEAMGFTTRGASLATCTGRQLASVGLDLTKGAPEHHEIVFLNPHEVIYKHGVLFTSGTHKGQALFKFLGLINRDISTISEVVFINDKRSNLAEVQETCFEMGVSFIGLRYGFTDEKVRNLSDKVATVQFEHFGKLMTDEEAEAQVNGRRAGSNLMFV